MVNNCRYTKFERVDKWGTFKVINPEPEYKNLNIKNSEKNTNTTQRLITRKVFIYTKHASNFFVIIK